MILKSTFIAAFTLLVTLYCFAGGGQPNADFTISDSSIRLGQVVTFIDMSTKGNCTNDLNSWSWDFGTGASPATATSQDPGPIRYSTPGIKSIRLTVRSQSCSSDFELKTIEVIDAPIPTMSQWTLLVLGLLITSIAVGRIWMAIKMEA